MTTTNVIAILLFILPGILAEKISHKMDFPSGKKRTDFGEIINGLVLSFPILFFVLLIAGIFLGYPTLKEYADNFNNVWFLLLFTIITLIVTLIFGVVANPIKKRVMELLNKHRKKHDKMKMDSSSCWRKFSIDINKPRFLEVIQDGHSYKGFVDHYSLPDEDRAISLKINEVLYCYKDFDPDKLFTKVIGIYVDIEKHVVIKDYDMTDYNNWCEENKNN